jgi:hypothetical protein
MRHILLAATALVLLAGGAYAQNATSNSGSNTTVTTQSGSQSSSQSNPRVNVIGNPIGNGASSSTSGSTSGSRSNSRSVAAGNVTNVYTGTTGTSGGTAAGTDPASTTGTGTTAGSGGGDPTVNYAGGYTLRNTPEVIAPNVMGGNTCAVGASGGIATPGFGLALGATWADRACELRQQAALLYNMGEQKSALELMCQNDNIRSAMRIAARPCAADIPVPAPAAAAPVAAVAPPAMPVAAKPGRPEWCYTASAAELRRHAECAAR